MKKLVMDAKVALGTAPKTVDPEYDRQATSVRSTDNALLEYKLAVEKMKSAAQSLCSAMESMSKAFDLLSNGGDVTEAMKKTAREYEAVVKKVNNEFLVDFKRALDDHEAMRNVKELTSDCKRLEGNRNKVMTEYDTYRDAVDKKVSEYKKKNKDLSESKHHYEDVAKRDSLKKDFEKADKDFKNKYAELEKKKILAYRSGMSDYLKGTSHFLDSIEKELARVHS
ncbi:hypothetical protein ABL78_5808 [Leptomonas seymouri]|uniref:BAR domain-containing protein n=1 Tax=Leptomonas seymouri TaxID=5684 RepID=A0A0N1PD85_LEPSE|nr:hypothetical protein ABL78_5808 [Leptomonas seymouri]|eukprot:KPI85148.1 hypothetical protein ABL78_5808 [Leptomonas seymouri]